MALAQRIAVLEAGQGARAQLDALDAQSLRLRVRALPSCCALVCSSWGIYHAPTLGEGSCTVQDFKYPRP